MQRDQEQKETKKNKWIGAVIVLLLVAPNVVIPVGVLAGIVWLVVKAGKQNGAKKPAAAHYTTRQEKFDECPQPLFCRHKDKAEHHVRRGKEIDPWDRPDIDISKYQRKG